MLRGLKIAAVSLLASIAVGVVAVSFGIVAAESRENLRDLLTARSGWVELAIIALFASLPVSLPAGIVGGIFASRSFAKHAVVRSTSQWLAAGSGWGAVIGAGITWLVFGWASIDSDNPLALLLMFGAYGTLSGAVVGSVVGCYCACAGRRLAVASR